MQGSLRDTNCQLSRVLCVVLWTCTNITTGPGLRLARSLLGSSGTWPHALWVVRQGTLEHLDARLGTADELAESLARSSGGSRGSLPPQLGGVDGGRHAHGGG